MGRNPRSNPLALAVLCCLFERPMHPYEIAQTLRSRHKHDSIKLNYGSLYGVVAALEKRDLIHALETVREGRRPERTVYELTEAGAVEMADWLSELVAVPQKEYLGFEAALSLLAAIPPADARELLTERLDALKVRLTRQRAVRLDAAESIPRLFLLEEEYTEALLAAEIAFVESLLASFDDEDLSGLEFWSAWHEGGEPPV